MRPMSHHTISPSPEGTPLAERTVGELVAERPGRSRIFQKRGMNFCCEGGRTLREACEKSGALLEEVLRELEAENAGAAAGIAAGEDPAALPPGELAAHIVSTHHAFLRAELPRIGAMAERVARVHGGHTPSLVEVRDVFGGLAAELDLHMMKEEQVLFPVIAALASGEAGPSGLEGPIACMMHEHREADGAMDRLRELTGGYVPPAEACNTYRALFAGLGDLERDLRRHIRLEDEVLFPAAREMAGSVRA